MTLGETLLQRLADWRPQGRQTLTAAPEGAGWTVAVTADRSDEVGCLLWELTLRRTTPPTACWSVQAWAERAASRVTGLLEPLKVYEVDSLRDEALLRSDGPAQRGEALFYYELLLRGSGEAVLRRYQAAHNGQARREQATFALTHEALAKLATDLTADG
jgi:hypothetical protein